MNPRHPVNPALKEEGGVRTAHWLEGRSGDACVSSLAGSSRENPGQREGTRRTAEGRKRASRRQSRKVAAEPGEASGSAEEPRREPRRRLPPAHPAQRRDPRRRDPRKRLPPARPPLKVPVGRVRVASAPLTKTVRFRLVSGTHFLFRLSDSVTPPL